MSTVVAVHCLTCQPSSPSSKPGFFSKFAWAGERRANWIQSTCTPPVSLTSLTTCVPSERNRESVTTPNSASGSEPKGPAYRRPLKRKATVASADLARTRAETEYTPAVSR